MESIGTNAKVDCNVTLGIVPYYYGRRGWNVLHLASWKNFVDIAKVLKNMPNQEMKTFMFAFRGSSPTMVP